MPFAKPVTILIGLGFPSTVQNVVRAYAMLADWPMRQRGGAHEAALSACRAALTGQGDEEVARAAFVEFARQAGILTSDSGGPLEAVVLKKTGGRGAPT
ncbi:DUF982 domain-containing protein [Arvimicrobium flavum]|uniref:DUF982 domain-containing protein n=1 Tax=Arvimicrobium flavum TaxID=3393320 RepID=UPI00237AC2B9|nr:DUF982 domain-containing protein [Mesorhizobium shangrilense]